MNQTSSSTTGTSLSSGTDFTSLLTSVHLIWLVILAAVVIAGILYGSYLKRRRSKAERAVVDHAQEAGVEPQPTSDAAAPQAPAAPPATVSQPVATASDDAAAAGNGPAARPVTQLKGLGPKVAARLGELGVTTVGQIAMLDHDAAQRLDAQLGPFSGRMERDRWVEQARFIAAGDIAGFEAVFGRL